MDSAVAPHSRFLALRPPVGLIPITGTLPAGHAADARQAVDATPRAIALLRTVATRPAAPPAPPGMATIASTPLHREPPGPIGGVGSPGNDIAPLPYGPGH